MVEFLKRLVYDESAFERYARAAILGLAGLAATGSLELPHWATAALMTLAGLIGAGDKNPDRA